MHLRGGGKGWRGGRGVCRREGCVGKGWRGGRGVCRERVERKERGV